MGRARSQRYHSHFDSALGSGRGSVVAQAQRDANERVWGQQQHLRKRESALHAFTAEVNERAHPLARRLPITVPLLASAYTNPDYPRELPPGLTSMLLPQRQLQDHLTRSVYDASTWDELIAIIALGDPDEWQGLTTPVYTAINHYWQDPNPPGGRAGVYVQAERLSKALFGTPYDLFYFQRLQPLCDSLAKLIASGPEDMASELRYVTAAIMVSVPTDILTGPLRSWVDAFDGAAENGSVDDLAAAVILDAYARESAAGTDVVYAAVVAKLQAPALAC